MTEYSATRAVADILLQLHDELAVGGTQRVWEACPNPDANRLLLDNPFAFLLAVIADYGVPAERAWELSWGLQGRLGHLDPAEIAGMGAADLEAAIRAVQGHRFPNEVSRYFIAAAEKVVSQYGADAARIWSGRGVHDALLHLDAFPGIGQKKASMAVNILCRDLRWMAPVADELPLIDVSYDVHVRRVFLRTGLVDQDSLDNVLGTARRLHPAYPGKLDLGAWHVGRTWCWASNPDCASCRLSVACAKLTERQPSEG